MYTIEEIQNMSSEELAAANKSMSKILARRFVTRIVVSIAAVYVVDYAVNRIADKFDSEKN